MFVPSRTSFPDELFPTFAVTLESFSDQLKSAIPLSVGIYASVIPEWPRYILTPEPIE